MMGDDYPVFDQSKTVHTRYVDVSPTEYALTVRKLVDGELVETVTVHMKPNHEKASAHARAVDE